MERPKENTLQRLMKERTEARHLLRKWRYDTSIQLFALIAMGILATLLMVLLILFLRSLVQAGTD